MTIRPDPQSPDPREVRVAYLVTTHHDLPQLQRLVGVVRESDPTGRIHISHDRAGGEGPLGLTVPGTIHVELVDGSRGDAGQIERLLDLGDAVAADGGADFVVFLSGEDYPSRPLREMKEALLASGDGFLHRFPVLDLRSEWRVREGRQRYCYRWSTGWPISTRWRDRLHLLHGLSYLQPFVAVNVAYGRLRVGLRRLRSKPPFELFGGSAWCSLSWRAFRHATDVIRTDQVQAWMPQSIAVDEVVSPSALATRSGFTFSPASHRHMSFRGTRFGHPAYLTGSDYEDVRRSGAFFARKVRSKYSDSLLAQLDVDVLGVEHATSDGRGASIR